MTMKLHFEPNLDYQHAAIKAVCDLFRGQETCRTEFTVTRDALAAQQPLAFIQSDLGIGNRLQLLDELRTEEYLTDPVFEVLKKHGVGLVFSHWTWLPPLRKQLAKVRGESDELRGILCQSLPV
jgi:hypothetical protein